MAEKIKIWKIRRCNGSFWRMWGKWLWV